MAEAPSATAPSSSEGGLSARKRSAGSSAGPEGDGAEVSTSTTQPPSKRSKKKAPKDKRKSISTAKDESAAGEPKGVVLSSKDCAPMLKLSDDKLTVLGDKGFRMVRATDAVSSGVWYYEATINSSDNPNAHTRIGWATAKADIQAPVGYDAHSYAYRDIAGSAVHASVRRDGYGESYGPGDVIGLMIKLPSENAVDGDTAIKPQADEQAESTLDSANVKNADEPSTQATVEETWIRFFKNGEDQGVAFHGLDREPFYPAVSLYMGASVTVNFGPTFKFPPKDFQFQPVSAVKEPSDDLENADLKAIGP